MLLKDIKTADVKSVYYGRPGCCCGCRGTHSSKPKQVSRVLNLVQSNPESAMDETGRSYAFYETDKRIYIVYLVKEGR